MSYPQSLPRFELELGTKGYPEQLACSSDPPERLFGIGDPKALVPGLAVVGARKATPYGMRASRLFAGWAACSGYSVISGGAIGCDQVAHRAALDNGGVSIAVMAGGADVVYPRSAHELLGRIAVSGAVVSEHAWGKEPLRWMFRTRNRIIAGLSVAVLVTEAAVGSGTFSTAEYADDAGRDVLVVPGSIFAPECAGANRLIRQGAIAITEVDDLRAALEPVLGPVKKDAIDEVASSFGVQGTETDPLLAAIVANPQRPDDLARGLGLDIVTVARRLGRLEADGRIERYRDGRYGIGR